MKKKILANYDEIDLIPILKIIWNGRIKILLIVIVSLLIGLGYLYQLPNEYSYTSNIEKNDNSEFEKFKILNLDNYLGSPLIQKTYVVDKFIYELKDNKELMFVLKDTKNFRENFAKSQTLEKKRELFKHTKLLEIKKIDDSNIVLNLKWHDSEEIIDILKDTINLTIDNLEKSIIEDMNKIIEINNLKNQKKN
jgi:LPS O-antigen subunit length determinant protein (WzzB/FepE family)